jgi:hypothetical protein
MELTLERMDIKYTCLNKLGFHTAMPSLSQAGMLDEIMISTTSFANGFSILQAFGRTDTYPDVQVCSI